MRRLAAILVLAGACIGLAPATATASGWPPQPEDLVVSGSFTASGYFSDGVRCPDNLQRLDGSGEWSGVGAGALHLGICFPLAAFPFPVGGTFSLTTADGTVSGSVDGTIDQQLVLELALTVEAGTGRFDGATGTLALRANLRLPRGFPGPVDTSGSVDGTLTIPPPMPTSRADCRGGGWRNFVDDQGRPFRSRGHCTAFVDRRM